MADTARGNCCRGWAPLCHPQSRKRCTRRCISQTTVKAHANVGAAHCDGAQTVASNRLAFTSPLPGTLQSASACARLRCIALCKRSAASAPSTTAQLCSAGSEREQVCGSVDGNAGMLPRRRVDSMRTMLTTQLQQCAASHCRARVSARRSLSKWYLQATTTRPPPRSRADVHNAKAAPRFQQIASLASTAAGLHAGVDVAQPSRLDRVQPLLEALATRERREQFEHIFAANQWKCATLTSSVSARVLTSLHYGRTRCSANGLSRISLREGGRCNLRGCMQARRGAFGGLSPRANSRICVQLERVSQRRGIRGRVHRK